MPRLRLVRSQERFSGAGTCPICSGLRRALFWIDSLTKREADCHPMVDKREEVDAYLDTPNHSLISLP